MKKVCIALFIVAGLAQMTFGQCYPDRHSTNWFDSWLSCEESPSPNTDRADGHWILYNLGDIYKLTDSYFWNVNDPSYLESGIRQAVIDVSYDGVVWTEVGGVFNFDQGTGESIYQGTEGPDLDVAGQFVLITALENFGGDCYGFSEIKFGYDDAFVSVENPIVHDDFCMSVNVFPNPFEHEAKMVVSSNCGSDIYYSISDVLGREIQSPRVLSDGSTKVELMIGKEITTAGTYMLNLRQGDIHRQYRLMKIQSQ